jgi:hypothetical protein
VKPFNKTNKLSKNQRKEVDVLFKGCMSKLHLKDDLFQLTVEGIRIGDLVYDTYLKNKREATVDLNSEYLQVVLLQAICSVVFWRDIARTDNAYAVIVSHTCYLNGIPARVFIINDKKAFQVNHAGVYQVSINRPIAYTEYHDFRVIAENLDPDTLKKMKTYSRGRLQQRFSGDVGVDMAYSTKSAYGQVDADTGRVIRESDNLKVLIAAHCLFDAPNGYGDNLFIDFQEWLEFLSDISSNTSYDWYLKTHPDFLPGNEDKILEIISGSNIQLIPSSTSHHQMISEGIDIALTVYGTIGFEYAALGKTVINASLTNPHIAYSFNTHPKTISEYRETLINLPSYVTAHKDDSGEIPDDVLEYYSMKLYTDTARWFFPKWDDIVKNCKGEVPLGRLDAWKSIMYLIRKPSFHLHHWARLGRELDQFIASDVYKFYPEDNDNNFPKQF